MVIAAALVIVLLAGWFGLRGKLTAQIIISILIIALMIAVAVLVSAPDKSREYMDDRGILIIFSAIGLGLAWLSYGAGMAARRFSR